MNRRTFLALCSAASGLLVDAASGEATNNASANHDGHEIFPQPPLAKALTSIRLDAQRSWDEIALLTSLQGLVNRANPKIYFVRDANDKEWLEYYTTRYGIEHVAEISIDALIEQFRHDVQGYVVYDPNMLDSANVATTFGAIEGLVPVSPELAPRLKAFGIEEKQNFTKRWRNRYDAYRWALRNLWPRCNQRLLVAACVDRPLWPSESMWLRDYAMAHTLFTFDLSASVRDREDLKLFHEILEATSNPGCILGWRCTRCNEHEFVGLAARYGLSVLSAVDTRNLTVHSAIPRPSKPFVQHHAKPDDIGEVEKKVYISFMATDGDALSSMLHCQADRFDDPKHGSVPFSWGFLPIAFDLMPGVATRNYERKTDNDYFVAPSSGAMYTYPFLQRDPKQYLEISGRYMEKTDLRVAYMINWIDDQWWQEMDLPRFASMLRRELPACIGFLRGQGESPFERQYLGDGLPYVFCGEGLHRDSDVYATFSDFIAANPIRPLFIFCLTNHSVSLDRIKNGIDRLPKDSVKLLRADEFLLTAEKAHRLGLIPADDFYPDKSSLRVMLQKEAKAQWPDMLNQIRTHATITQVSRKQFLKQTHEPDTEIVLRRSETSPEDLIAHTAVWDSMTLVKLALNQRGIYVNNKAKAVNDFAREFGQLSEAGVVTDLWSLWADWQTRRPTYNEASQHTQRLLKLATEIETLFA